MNKTIIGYLLIVMLVASCRQGKDDSGKSNSLFQLGQEMLVSKDNKIGLEGATSACQSLRNKKFNFQSRADLSFSFDLVVNTCASSVEKNVVNAEMVISGDDMQFSTTTNYSGFIKEIVTDTAGVFAAICPDILSGKDVSSLKDSGDGRQIHYSFGNLLNDGTVKAIVTTAINNSGKYLVSQIEEFVINASSRVVGPNSDQGLVESRSKSFKCQSGIIYSSTQTVRD